MTIRWRWGSAWVKLICLQDEKKVDHAIEKAHLSIRPSNPANISSLELLLCQQIILIWKNVCGTPQTNFGRTPS